MSITLYEEDLPYKCLVVETILDHIEVKLSGSYGPNNIFLKAAQAQELGIELLKFAAQLEAKK